LNLLDEEEKQFLEPFKVPPSPLDAEDDSNLTIVQRAFKKRKIASNTQYLDLTYLNTFSPLQTIAKDCLAYQGKFFANPKAYFD
jgi:hypothetical protein